MAPALTDDLDGVLRSLVALYGDGQPAGQAASVTQAIAADMRAHSGAVALRYGEAQGMQLSIAESHAGKDSIVSKAVGESGDGTVNGRGRLTNHIADFQARMQAIASVGDTRFSGPALLAAAQTTISNATKQVDADVAAARQQASQIMPPATPPTRQARHGGVPRRRRRTRSRARSRSASRLRRDGMVRSDGTKGGNAVLAASKWLGTDYVWGGGGAGGPSGGGFDCSGLTQYAIAQASNGEVVLPRTTYEQIYSGVRVHPDDVRAGDLVFPGSSFSTRGPEHVQLAAGNGMVIEAPYTGSVVKWSRMDSNSVVVRVL
ncbi:C40 family peptidase [Streptomyces gardneri]|uniref:C40 family peptidase n=1 Tax=Nocardia sputi TaxID=2943705 RepID=UPI00189619A3|nr:NlpC/P60 family protein [Nocardia sputi]MBF6164671.1 C40 family peptidase [Streptomyces gardneri]MBF6209055.1 C40 family peptidase [Streptomyces gardneri]UAK32713.1 C40 family peptidase [Nocardia asteroides]